MINIILYNKSLYKNIDLSIDGLKISTTFDSFWLEDYLKKSDISFQLFLKKELERFIVFALEMENKKSIFYPIEISDQAASFIIIRKLNSIKYNVLQASVINVDLYNELKFEFDSNLIIGWDSLIITNACIMSKEDLALSKVSLK